MTKLVWGQTAQKRYEAGVDRGVLYPSDEPGVVWNGLVSIDESFEGGESTSYHFDGVKYLDVVSPKNFQATLTAFSAPAEFGPNVGDRSVVPGFVLTRQPRLRFNLSYRTLIDDSAGYKLHLIYNALASPGSRGYKSIDSSVSAETLSWKIDAVPPTRSTYRPSAHFVLDSTKVNVDALVVIETLLYGSTKVNARMPSVEELFDIVTVWAPLRITAQTVTGLAQLVAGSGDLYRTKVEGILRALPTTRLYMSPTNGLYRME